MISAFGVVHELEKADRRFAPGTGKSALYLPKHSSNMVAARKASQVKKPLAGAQAIRAGLRATKI